MHRLNANECMNYDNKETESEVLTNTSESEVELLAAVPVPVSAHEESLYRSKIVSVYKKYLWFFMTIFERYF